MNDDLSIQGIRITPASVTHWITSSNIDAKALLSDDDLVLVTLTYDDGSLIMFRRTPE